MRCLLPQLSQLSAALGCFFFFFFLSPPCCGSAVRLRTPVATCLPSCLLSTRSLARSTTASSAVVAPPPLALRDLRAAAA